MTAWQLFTQASITGQAYWAVGFVLSFAVVALLKIWFWMVLNRNAVLREVKRLELQLARLAHE